MLLHAETTGREILTSAKCKRGTRSDILEQNHLSYNTKLIHIMVTELLMRILDQLQLLGLSGQVAVLVAQVG
jgi:hypothetical protein